MSDRHSVISNLSARSRASRADVAAEVAALKVKYDYVKQEASKRAELSQLQAKMELEMAQAKLSVLDEYDSEQTYLYGDSHYKPPNNEQSPSDYVKEYVRNNPLENKVDSDIEFNYESPALARHETTNKVNHANQINPIGMQGTPFVDSTKLDIRAKEFVPKQFLENTCTSNHFCGMADISKTLTEQMNLNRLPTPEPGIFSGDPLHYPGWKSAFETLIEKREIAGPERLYYLKRYLGGTAREALEGYFLLTTDDAYAEAKELLEKRYGNTFVIANAFRDKLKSWPKIQNRDSIAMRKYGDFLRQCLIASRTNDTLKVLNDERENRNMISKLPDYVSYSWARTISEWKERSNHFPPFGTFVDFVVKEANVACETVSASHVRDKPRSFVNQFTQKPRSDRKPAVALSTENGKQKCPLCEKGHHIENCKLFLEKDLQGKREVMFEKGMCFGCLRRGHLSKECLDRKTCNTCSKKHPTVLHSDVPIQVANMTNQTYRKTPEPVRGVTGVAHLNETGNVNKCSMIVPVWLSHQGEPRNERLVYALLDTQSDTTFVLEDTCRALNLEGPEVKLELSTMYAESQIVDSMKVTGLRVRGYQSDVVVPLPAAYTRNIMPTNRDHIPTPEKAHQWSHLSRIAGNLMPLCDAEVGLLIGYNCSQALAPRDVIPPTGNEPYAQRTDLGWGIVGVIDPDNLIENDSDPIGVSHRVLALETPMNFDYEGSTKEVFVSLVTSVKETLLPYHAVKMLELDFSECHNKNAVMSYEDQTFMKIMREGIQQLDDSHYEMPLPFKRTEPKLPNNKVQALHSLNQLSSRFKRDPKVHNDYVTFMEKIISNGQAERVPENELNDPKINTWYIPHHGVYHAKKPNKIRVVFDCSAKYKGECLNDHLLQGPDLTNALLGVLLRFRQERIAFMCDLEQMFFQFRVKKEHQDYLRILWWDKGAYETEPVEYRLQVHLFGATSSPGCSNFGLKQIAHDYESKYGYETANFLRHDFYVDDVLKSLPTVDQAVNLITNSRKLCNEGGLRLHKIISNSREVIMTIPPEDRAKELKDFNLNHDKFPIERALGVQWNVESDTFQFRIILQDQPLTRRGILSTVSSVYDPLGFLAPVVMVGKTILQQMCRDSTDWDDPLSDDLKPRWEKWRNELLLLESVSVQRCYKPSSDFGEVKSVEIHNFSDGSNVGYGQCSYLRLIDTRDHVHCSFLMGKSRVSPLKQLTIPRLELAAAVVSVRISALLCQELEYTDIKEIFWTDSKIVIGYISNDSKRFQVFVSNRVSQIREHSSPLQWKHVKGEENPADDASRGLTVNELVNKSRWLTGPLFLWKPTLSTDCEIDTSLDPNDPEIKKAKALSAQTTESPKGFELERLKHCSSWYRAKRTVALCLKLRARLKTMCRSKEKTDAMNIEHDTERSVYESVTVADICQAENEIIHLAQKEEFGDELKLLSVKKEHENHAGTHETDRRRSSLKTASKLHKLDPFIDCDGIIRVGGRVRRGSLSNETKHPAVMPRKHYLTNLLIKHFHEKTHHQGRGMTTNEIRASGFWIIGCSSAVSSYIYRCVTCRRSRGTVQEQKMADLPKERVDESPPFTYCGVDVFGPFLIKEKRSLLKRYGVLFTCLACRAVHVEVACTMTTDSFINALRRFIAIRGPIRELRCDRGTNFVGACNELREAWSEMNSEQVQDFLLRENCDIQFNMNVPSASHMGGSWERQIRTVRNVLSSLLEQTGQQLNDEGLRTLVYEASAIVNSRPLSVDNLNDPTALGPLSSSNLLTMKSKIVLPPPGNFQKTDMYSHKQWRRVQYLLNEFWTRWRKEVLQNLQIRQKWTRPRRNLQVGDIVILKDDNLARSQWPLARVHETYVDADDHVRKVKIAMADNRLDSDGKRRHPVSYLERPIQKLVLLIEQDDDVEE